MKLWNSRTDFFVASIWIVIYIAYCEVFGDNGPLFYLINTPPILFILPPLVYLFYTFFKRNLSIFPFVVFFLMYVHLSLFSGREIVLRKSLIADTTHTTNVRVCSWNTAYFFKWGKEVGLQRLVDQQCDLILLQEVWKSENMNEDILKVRDIYFPNYYFYNHSEFLAFAKKGITISDTKSATNSFYSIQSVINGKKLDITSVHLWNPIVGMPINRGGILSIIPAQEARALQKMDLLQHISKPNLIDSTSLIIGDFNTLQNGRIIREIAQLQHKRYSFVSTPVYISKNTYSTRFPIIQIDFAYISSEAKNRASLKTICKPNASDHCLLIVDLVL